MVDVTGNSGHECSIFRQLNLAMVDIIDILPGKQ